MIYNLQNEIDRQRVRTRFEFLLENRKTIELKEKKPKRSINQNSYLHLILSWFSWEYGETLDYVKQEIFKKIVNKEIFKTEYANFRTGEVRTAWRSSAELDTREMTIAIDRFRDYASREAGIYLPEPRDLALIEQIERELSQQGAEKWI